MGSIQGFLLDVSIDVETLFSGLSLGNAALPLEDGRRTANELYDFYNGGTVNERYTGPLTYSAGLHEFRKQLSSIKGIQVIPGKYWDNYTNIIDDGNPFFNHPFQDRPIRRTYLNPLTAGLPATANLIERLAGTGMDLMFKHITPQNANPYTLRRSDKCVLYTNTSRRTFNTVRDAVHDVGEGVFDTNIPLFTKPLRAGVSHIITPELERDVVDWFRQHSGEEPSGSYGNYISIIVTVGLQQAVPKQQQNCWRASTYSPEEFEALKDTVKGFVIERVRKGFTKNGFPDL